MLPLNANPEQLLPSVLQGEKPNAIVTINSKNANQLMQLLMMYIRILLPPRYEKLFPMRLMPRSCYRLPKDNPLIFIYLPCKNLFLQ